ncbi:tail fiber domain-containing protein [Hyphomicrobium sp. DY-1]|uniref:tail fiber domain-containing protein n=1 Tax=Hyphomicrobium sp. DY-1 TaxID=3075650 RepID=UPI0039C35666
MSRNFSLRLLLSMVGLLMLAQGAYAACSSPTGTGGDMTYSTSANVMAYCDGTNWISMNGGVSLTVNTSGGGTVTPYGATNDIQINNGGALGGDTGTFTYNPGTDTLAVPYVSATAISAINQGTFGGLLVNGGMTVTGVSSLTTVSASIVSATLIQIGNSGAACTGGLAGGLRYSTVSNTMEYCTGTVWMSLGPSATVVPAFLVTKGGVNQTGVTTNTKLTWPTVKLDPYSMFDTANNRFKPNIAGTYLLNASAYCSDSTGYCQLFITKNGSGIPSGNGLTRGSSVVVAGTAILTMNGTTDYAEVNVTNNGGSTVAGAEGATYFQGSLLSMVGGGSGGGTANPAGSTGDVQFNTGGLLAADTGNFFWDSTNHRLGIGTDTPAAALQVSGGLIVSATGQDSLASASLAVDSRGVSVSSIIHLGSNAIVPIGAGGNAILSGTTAVSTSSAGSITFYAGGAQRLGIDANGNIGIGTLTPTQPLEVNYNSNGTKGLLVKSGATATARIDIQNATKDYALLTGMSAVNDDKFAIYDSTAAAARLVIDGSGNVLVGYISGLPNPGVGLTPDGSLLLGKHNSAGGTWYTGFYYNGGAIGSIAQNGTTAVAYNTTSDRRVKENITDSRGGLQKLMQIGVKDFSFKTDPSHTIVNGFIAQDLNKVYPEAVTTNGDNGEVPLKDKSKIWQVDYGRVTPLIVKAVQDLKHLFDTDHDEVVKLKTELKAANDNIKALTRQVTELRSDVTTLRAVGR